MHKTPEDELAMLRESTWRRALVYAARRLRNAPGFATIAIATLAIGIGVNAAMFGLIEALLFRAPAHVSDPDRVVRIKFTSDSTPGAKAWYRQNFPAYQDLTLTGAFGTVAGYSAATVSIGRGADAIEGNAVLVTPSFFRTLGVRPHLGTLLGPIDSLAEDRVVLSYGFWERQFGKDPRVIGSSLVIGVNSHLVIGVAPDGFTSLQERPADIWIPMGDLSAPYLFRNWRSNRGSVWLDVVARVPASTTIEAAQQRAGAVLRRLRAESGGGSGSPGGVVTASLIAARDAEKSREVRVSLWLAGVTAFVLLIACANVANLVLARNVARRQEYAVRLSLGASDWQLRQQLIADVFAIALPGMAAAMFVEYAVRRIIPAFLASDVPIPAHLIDPRALTFMLVSGVAALTLIAAVSLLQVQPSRIVGALSTQAREQSGSAWTRNSLLAIQSALCLSLLFSAGLFAQSLYRVLTLDFGVEIDRTVQVGFNLPRGARNAADVRALYDRAAEQVRALPGVERVALAQAYPFTSGMGLAPFTADVSQREMWEGKGEVSYSTVVGSGYFAAAGATSLTGRDFTDNDKAGAPKVAVVNAPLAARLFPRGGALGNCVFLPENRECYRVVGVLGGVWKLRALERGKMAIYLPLAQMPEVTPGALMVRTRGARGAALMQIRRTMQTIEPGLPAVNAQFARGLLDGEIRPWRLGATMFAGFGFVALLIAAIGVYGVVSFTTTLRTREIGVRMALGASGSAIVRVVAGAGLGAVLVGLVAGAGASLVVSRWMGEVLYQTSPRDPAVLGETALVLLLVACLAVVVPVIRALRLSPASVLRSE